ncbi:MAG: hypothetical protein IBX64_06950 [Actinobacteria bacterium]|nr:hypothetical protein [Actinomycetota bacterium]
MRIISAAITGFIILSLVFISPASALKIDIAEPSPKTLGQTISFSFTITVEDSELLPIRRVDLEIYKENEPAVYHITCLDLPLTATSKTYPTAAGDVTVTAVPGAGWGYGYGYGYAIWESTGYYWGYGYGYGGWGYGYGPEGYGYGYGFAPTSITYSVTWSSPATWPAGDYVVKATVLANGDTFSKTRTVALSVYVYPVTAKIDIDPDTLNLKSRGRWITAYIELPEGYDAADIDVSTVLLNDKVPAESMPTGIGDYDEDGIPDLMVKFDRAMVKGMLSPGDAVELTVTGELIDGTPFKGSDTIRVISKGK